MITFALEQRVRAILSRTRETRHFPAMVGAVAFVLTVTMSVPFASVLVFAVLLQPERWRAIALWSAVGAAVGGLLL